MVCIQHISIYLCLAFLFLERQGCSHLPTSLVFPGDGTVPIMLSLGLLTVSNYVPNNHKVYNMFYPSTHHWSISICPIIQEQMTWFNRTPNYPGVYGMLIFCLCTCYSLPIRWLEWFSSTCQWSVVQFLELCTRCFVGNHSRACYAWPSWKGTLWRKNTTKFIVCFSPECSAQTNGWLTCHCLQGNSYTASKIPPKPIEIWAYEVWILKHLLIHSNSIQVMLLFIATQSQL